MKVVIIAGLHGNYDALQVLPEQYDELWGARESGDLRPGDQRQFLRGLPLNLKLSQILLSRRAPAN